MPAKRIIKSSLSALIASCLAFASGPSFGQNNECPEPVRVTKRTSSSSVKTISPKKATVATQGERVSLSKTTKPAGTRLKKGADNSVVPASSLDDKAPLQMPENESVIVSEEPLPMVSQEEWSYPSAYERMGSGYPGSGAPGTQVYIDTGILGGILSRTKVRIEGATFWGSGYTLDPIVTTGPANILPPTNVGTIVPGGNPNTTLLFGGSEVMANTSQGLRFSTDLSFDRSGSRGLLFRMLYASEIGESYTNAGGPNIVVTRPFSSVPGSTPSTILINHPDATVGFTGTIDASVTSEVSGGDLLIRNTIGRDRYGVFDLLVGYQNMRLDEGLSVVSNNSRPNGTNTEALSLTDRFSTSNRFHGFALGVDSTVRSGQWSFGTMFKLGMGNIDREIDIDGFRRVTVTNQAGTVLSTATSTDSLLARNTNNGSYRSDRFIVSPEVALTLGYRFSPRMDATLTYTYLGLPSVARAGEQLDPDLQVNQSSPLTGPVAPRFLETTSHYSLHSLSYGIQWRF
jgi:hypothetical protein